MKNKDTFLKEKSRVELWIKFLCEVLMIPEPNSLEYGFEYPRIQSSKLDQNTKFLYTIKLPETSKFSTTNFFHIAHELRHAYQILQVKYYDNDDKLNLELYPDEIENIRKDIEELNQWEKESNKSMALSPNYNQRFIECDANAFAEIIMMLFDLEPKGRAFRNNEIDSDKIETKITECKKEILTIITLEDISAAVSKTNIKLDEYKKYFMENI